MQVSRKQHSLLFNALVCYFHWFIQYCHGTTCPGAADTGGVLWLLQWCLTSSAAFGGLREAWQVINISSQPSFGVKSWQLICAGNGICCLKHKQTWRFLHLHTVSCSVTAFGVEHPGHVTELQQWASSSHVRPSCACAQCDLTEFISKSCQKLINLIVLKTEEMLHFVRIYFDVLSIPNISVLPWCSFRYTKNILLLVAFTVNNSFLKTLNLTLEAQENRN